jgi:hypothetical protein
MREFRILTWLRQYYHFSFLPRCRNIRQPKAVIKQMCEVNQRSSWKVPKIFIRNAINSAGLCLFLSAVLHSKFLLSCHKFLSLCLSCRRLFPAARFRKGDFTCRQPVSRGYKAEKLQAATSTAVRLRCSFLKP